ncbi:lamin tail domain-containing protein [Candidatus Viridilinea mediisalina]|uniref:lamin tail domain-containing protein n=1 Tax=Candidatus Viridilinea mediisalina TaxID=2024553 RepID=UPI0013FD4419|nr:lamin tail domain-containing protein [Candidatus Viridilinea mediisalina]
MSDTNYTNFQLHPHATIPTWHIIKHVKAHCDAMFGNLQSTIYNLQSTIYNLQWYHPMRIFYLILVALLSLSLMGCMDSAPLLESQAEHPCDVSAYVELRNERKYTQTLANWTYAHNNVEQTLPTFTLAPGEHFRIWRGVGQDDEYNFYIGEATDTWNFSGNDHVAIIRPNSWWMIEHHWFICSTPSLAR